MRQRQPLALEIRTERADERGDRRADIPADRERERVLVPESTPPGYLLTSFDTPG